MLDRGQLLKFESHDVCVSKRGPINRISATNIAIASNKKSVSHGYRHRSGIQLQCGEYRIQLDLNHRRSSSWNLPIQQHSVWRHAGTVPIVYLPFWANWIWCGESEYCARPPTNPISMQYAIGFFRVSTM